MASKIRIWGHPDQGADEPASVYILRMLLQDLQCLASNPEVLLRSFWFPGPNYVPDDLANDFDSRLEQAARCVDEGLITPLEYASAKAVNNQLGEMTNQNDSSLWTDDALSTREEWAEIRRLAREALMTMGYELEPPRPWEETTRIFFAGEEI